MIAITGDWHCHNHAQYAHTLESGTNSRLQDIIDCAVWIASDAKSRGAKRLIHLGDVFHTRKSIEHTVLHRVIELFSELHEIIPTIDVISGNHDQSLTGDGSLAIKALGAYANIIGAPLTMSEQGLGFIPYTTDLDYLERTLKKFKKRGIQYIFAHLGVLGGKVGPSDFEVPGTVDIKAIHPKAWKHVFLGHFHKHQKVVENVTYVGSPLQLSFGERRESKGYVLLNEETGDWQFIENPDSPRFIVVDAAEYKTAGWRIQDFIKVKYSADQDIEALSENFKTNTPIHTELVRDLQVSKERIELAGKNDQDMLVEYVQRKPPETELDTDALVAKGVHYLNVARG